MHVASLELCKELYELSGWANTDRLYGLNDFMLRKSDLHDGMQDYHTPAYDLGYLLRKLPDTPAKGLFWRQGLWMGEFAKPDYKAVNTPEANTPEDAAAKLCLELFKQGILTKGDSDGTTN